MPERTVLTINTGSSSLKAAIFDADDLGDRHLTAQVEHIGHESALRVTDGGGNEIASEPLLANDHGEALAAMIGWFGRNGELDAPDGHRPSDGPWRRGVLRAATDQRCHAGMRRSTVPFDRTICRRRWPRRGHPAGVSGAAAGRLFRYRVSSHHAGGGAALSAVARVRARGRHPLRLSWAFYASIVEQLGERIAPRTIIAHLGNGASMAALRDGRSVDTTMGFTPLGGLMMGTRSGDLDPGVMLYLLQQSGRRLPRWPIWLTNQVRVAWGFSTVGRYENAAGAGSRR